MYMTFNKCTVQKLKACRVRLEMNSLAENGDLLVMSAREDW